MDLTRGIIPKAIHSHNDYWRDLPVYTALSVGCISIEADVWLVNGTLYIGHELSALQPARTFDSLYIQPILNILYRQNPTTRFINGSTTKNGVFDTSSSQILYLFVDLKTDGETTWPYVLSALEPLRSAGYLTTTNGTGITSGPVTIIGTGNTPLEHILNNTHRDYFYDAPLATLSQYTNITSLVSPIASTDYEANIGSPNGTTFNATQIDSMVSQINEAKRRGIAARYWNTPGWPISTRNAVWAKVLELGAGLLNADAVADAAGFSGTSGNW